MIDTSRACRRHRPALVAFIDRAEIATTTGEALAHLDRCRRCTEELEATVRTITALRRLGDDAARFEPSPDAWPRLRARLDGWRPMRWAVLSPTAAALMGAALVAVLVVPLRIGGQPMSDASPTPAPDRAASSEIDSRLEADYIRTIRQRTTSVSETVIRPAGTLPRVYPDGIRPEPKEVSPENPTRRPARPV